MSSGYELPLIKEQAAKGAGIFACEYFSVLSDAKVLLRGAQTNPSRGALGGALEPVTTDSIGDLHCAYGGPYNLALNSEIFVRAWGRVFEVGLYRLGSWTVKADVDAVFLPDRLRRLVAPVDPEARVFLNNCDTGLHGPVEVISLGAMKVFDANITDCVERLSSEFTWAGEDVFVRHCLGYIQTARIDAYTLLKEENCFNKNPRRDGCYTGEVSFHPLKDNAGWFQCLAQAEDTAKQTPISIAAAAAQRTAGAVDHSDDGVTQPTLVAKRLLSGALH